MVADTPFSVRNDGLPRDLATELGRSNKLDSNSNWPDLTPNFAGNDFAPTIALADLAAYQELDVSLDAQTKALWCFMRPIRAPSITPTILHDFLDLHSRITSGSLLKTYDNATALKYYIQGSHIPGIYNLGGDLAFIIECVQIGDRESLSRYAHDCVQVVFNISTGFNRNVVSIAVVEGDALGGALKLYCAVIISLLNVVFVSDFLRYCSTVSREWAPIVFYRAKSAKR